MKQKLLLITLLLIPLFSFSQEVKMNEESGLYSFSEVINAEGKKKDELFALSKQWIALTYKSANDVIQSADKETGNIIAKGTSIFASGLMYDGYIRHTLILDFKDDKIRFFVTDFIYSARKTRNEMPLEGQWTKVGRRNAIENLTEKCNELMFSLNKYISSSKKKDDW